MKVKGRPVSIGHDVEEFLRLILKPTVVDQNSKLPDFIRNTVLTEIWEKVQNAKAKGKY